MTRSKLMSHIRKIREALIDDTKDGALGSVITMALVCLAIIVFGR